MVRATASTWRRSADPSSPGGVPTAIRITSPCVTPAAASVVKRNRPARTLRSIMGARPGSWIGTSPRCKRAILSASTSTQSTRLPASAKQAPLTSPT